MKEIVLKLYEFDELSKDSQERIIERERWNIMDCCMEAYGADYISTMKSFGDLTNTEAYGWEVGYTRYDFRFKFKYNDPIYCHPTDYDKDIYILITYVANYCSGISTTTLCHVLSRAGISPRHVNMLMGNTSTSTNIVG